MFNLFDLEIISIILKKFKITDIILSSVYDTEIIMEILDYYEKYGSSLLFINSNNYLAENKLKINNLFPRIIEDKSIDILEGYVLNVLKSSDNFDAIFIQDDPNWYTIFNELSIIYEITDDFPLVFVCNNRFPFKYRDAYIKPDIIPKENLFEFDSVLPISHDNNIVQVTDGLFHAVSEKNSKNGVLTAVNDFLKEHSDVGLMNFNLGEIVILYPKTTISKIRIDLILEEIEKKELYFKEVPDELVENYLLLDYIKNSSKNIVDIDDLKSEISSKNNIINNFENKMVLYDDEINLKNSEIKSISEKLNSKNLKIEDIELKLVNKEMELSKIKNQLNHTKNELDKKEDYYKNLEINLKKEFTKKERDLKKCMFLMNSKIGSQEDDLKLKEEELVENGFQLADVNNKLKLKEAELVNADSQLAYVNEKLKIMEGEIIQKNFILESLKRESTVYSSKLNSKKYCISCYKEELDNNKCEIDYFKNNSTFLKRIMGLFSYIFLILKSNPKEISLNIKLYNALKNSKCFDIGYYLNHNQDIAKSNWCKYFSPELHYVCKGFSENRKFNKKYFNRGSKRKLLEYVLLCKEY